MKDLFSGSVIPTEVVSRTIWIEDQDDTTYCMFPAIIQCADQELLLTYYRGTGHITPVSPETPRSGRVELIRSRDGGKSWSTPTVVFDTENDDRETALTRISDGSIYLTINTQPIERPVPDETRCWSYVLRSKNEGHTWEQLGRIHRLGSKEWDLYVYRPLIEFSDGTLAATGITEGPGLLDGSLSTDTNQHMIAFSRDGGKTWGEHRTIAYDPERRLSFREWNAVLLPSGKLLAMQEPFGDSRFDVPFEITGEQVYFSYSIDSGQTWSKSMGSPFYGRACSFLVTSQGDLLFAGSPAFNPPHPPQTAISSDEGKTWKIIEDLPQWSTRSLYSGYYPNVIETQPGTFVAVGGGSPYRSAMTFTSFRLE